MDTIRLGTRGSELALWQARWVRDRLIEAWPEMSVEIVEISTKGDQDLTTPLSRIGQVGLFTHTLEQRLLAGEIDVAVHSLKDVPAQLAQGCVLACYGPREDPRDAWFQREGLSIADLPRGAKVATGSLRRRSQLLHLRGDLEMVELRGNLNTRWRKFEEGRFDGMVLAAAGVKRLGWLDRVTTLVEPEILLPAVGQGILGLETRSGDEAIDLLAPLNDGKSRRCAVAERALLEGVAGGCVVPLAGYCVEDAGELVLRARLGRPDGSRLLSADASVRLPDPAASAEPADPESLEAGRRLGYAVGGGVDDLSALETAYELGRAVAADLLSQGGEEIVREAKELAGGGSAPPTG